LSIYTGATPSGISEGSFEIAGCIHRYKHEYMTSPF
jgi:hypothetical protein